MMKEDLVVNNMNLVYGVLNKSFKSYLSNQTVREELVAVGNLALCTSAQTYDPSKGTNFSTYSYICIQREMVKYIKVFERQENKGRTINKEVSIDSPVKMNNDSGNTHTYEEIIPDTRFMIDDSADELLELARNSKIKDLEKIFKLEILGYNKTEMSKIMGYDKPKSFMRTYQHKKERFIEYLKEVGYKKRGII